MASCGFRRRYSGGTAPDLHRLPFEPSAVMITQRKLQRVKIAVKLRRDAGRRNAYKMSQKTSGMVSTEINVLSTTMDAARPGSWRYFSVKMKLTTAAGSEP